MAHELDGELVEFEGGFFEIVEVHFLIGLSLVFNAFFGLREEVFDMNLELVDVSEGFEGIHGKVRDLIILEW